MYVTDGILLLEVNRLLRAGGYFVWAAQPVYKHEAILEEQWKGMHLEIFVSTTDNIGFQWIICSFQIVSFL